MTAPLPCADRANLAAWSGKGHVKLMDSTTGKELARLEDQNQGRIEATAFTLDGGYLVGVSNDSSCIRAWNLRKLREGLVELEFDWDAPPFAPALPVGPGTLVVEIDRAQQK
jgi:hypothetical protein